MNSSYPLLTVATLLSIATPLVAGEAPGKPIEIEISFVEVPRAEQDDSAEHGTGAMRQIVGDVAVIRTLLALVGNNADAKTLSSPRIVTTSGRKATMQSGKELFVPVLQPNGRWGNEVCIIGTTLDVKPKATVEGITVDIDARVVEPDMENAITVNGVRVPGLATQALRTKVALDHGQAMLLIAEHSDATRLLLVHAKEVEARPGK